MARKIAHVIVLALAMSLALVAADSQFTGTWKLNVAKSKFSPGPPPKSVTVTIQPDGKVTVGEVTATGEPVTWSYMPNGETPATITGMQDATVIEKRVDDRTIDHAWKIGGESTTGHGVISKNGKTMKYTLTGTDAKGQPIHNVEIFERE